MATWTRWLWCLSLFVIPTVSSGQTQPKEIEVGWVMVCDNRKSAQSEDKLLAALIAAKTKPKGYEAIAPGCSWATFTLRLPIEDTDLPTLFWETDSELLGFYRAAATFMNGPLRGKTIKRAYVLLHPKDVATLRN